MVYCTLVLGRASVGVRPAGERYGQHCQDDEVHRPVKSDETQCPHRMACARCDFYTPKDSSQALLLEAKDNLQRMLAAVPLTDDERATVDDGHAALDQLLHRLADVPTPAGPTPRQLGIRATGTLLPIAGVHQGPPRHTTP